MAILLSAAKHGDKESQVARGACVDARQHARQGASRPARRLGDSRCTPDARGANCSERRALGGEGGGIRILARHQAGQMEGREDIMQYRIHPQDHAMPWLGTQ